MDDRPLSQWKIKNKQKIIARKAWMMAILFSILTLLPFFGNTCLAGSWWLSFVAFFLTLAGIVTALIFGSRSRKMKKLLNREQLIAQWQLDRESLKSFADENFRIQQNRNKVLLRITGVFFALVTIIFLFFLDKDERLFFLGIMFSVFLIVLAFALLMPHWYRYCNKKGNGAVLIGKKYLYLNGTFHNWDFPMSRFEKAEETVTPFRGIILAYRYTDRTGSHRCELKIPVPVNVDIKMLIRQIKGFK